MTTKLIQIDPVTKMKIEEMARKLEISPGSVIQNAVRQYQSELLFEKARGVLMDADSKPGKPEEFIKEGHSENSPLQEAADVTDWGGWQ